MITEIFMVLIYLTLLIVGSVVIHRRYKCVRASILTGLSSSFFTISVFVTLEYQSTDLTEYIGAFIYGGVGLCIISSVLSGFIGLPFQLRKN